MLERLQNERTEFMKDIPQLQQVIDSTWRKESDLASLKTEMEGLDRRIQLSLKPMNEDSGEEVTQNEESQHEQKVITKRSRHHVSYPVTTEKHRRHFRWTNHYRFNAQE